VAGRPRLTPVAGVAGPPHDGSRRSHSGTGRTGGRRAEANA
jgi:hypothetical protein